MIELHDGLQNRKFGVNVQATITVDEEDITWPLFRPGPVPVANFATLGCSADTARPCSPLVSMKVA